MAEKDLDFKVILNDEQFDAQISLISSCLPCLI